MLILGRLLLRTMAMLRTSRCFGVMAAAHLDPVRRAALFEQLRGSGAQVWMTGTELAPFSAIAGEAAVWRVSAGAVERD